MKTSIMDEKTKESDYDIARKNFYRLYFFAYKAREHASSALTAGDVENSTAATKVADLLERQAGEAYLDLQRLSSDHPRPAIIDTDVCIEEDLRLLVPEVLAAEKRRGYAKWASTE